MKQFILFPIDQVEKGSRVVIYAAGQVGKLLLQQVETLNYCQIVCFLDMNASSIQQVGKYPCVLPNQIQNFQFDSVIIAKSDKATSQSVAKYLNEQGIPSEKIITLKEKYFLDCMETKAITPAEAHWEFYYQEAEKEAETQYHTYLEPLFEKYIIKSQEKIMMDFACGEGRIAQFVTDKFQKLYCCEVQEKALETCKKRFQGKQNVEYVLSRKDGISLPEGACDVIFSWDAMVHFDFTLMDFYLEEFHRLITPNGIAILHHANIKKERLSSSVDDWLKNPGSRGNFSKEDLCLLAQKHGFQVLEQQVIDWGVKNLDCISIIQRKE